MGKKITVELTAEQRDQLRQATGKDIDSFTMEPLEERDAPKVAGSDVSSADWKAWAHLHQGEGRG